MNEKFIIKKNDNQDTISKKNQSFNKQLINRKSKRYYFGYGKLDFGHCLFLVICFLIIFSLGCTRRTLRDKNRVCFKEICFHVEIAQSIEEQARGLQFRKDLPPDHGMLFIFQNKRKHFFWMKDTSIPLDMIWLDQNREVIHIEENVPPCQRGPCPSYGPTKGGLYVLELNAHRSREISLQVGDQMEFQLNDL